MPFGAVLGSSIGGAFGAAIQAAREAGIRNVDHLVTQAMLNPAVAQVLLTKVTPQNETMLAASLRSQLGRLSLVSTSQQQDRNKSAQPMRKNARLR